MGTVADPGPPATATCGTSSHWSRSETGYERWTAQATAGRAFCDQSNAQHHIVYYDITIYLYRF